MMVYLYAGAGALILALLGLLYVRNSQIHRLQLTNASLTVQLATAHTANDAQLATIGQQSLALKAWKDLAVEHEAAIMKATDAVVKAHLERDRATAKMLELDAQDAARKECAAVLAEDIAASCPDIARNMQERAK